MPTQDMRWKRVNDHSGGMNVYLDDDAIEDKFSPALQNVRINGRMIESREGFGLKNAQITGGTGKIDGLAWYDRVDPDNDVLVSVYNRKLYYDNSGAWTEIVVTGTGFTVEADTNFVSWRDKMYFLNGTDKFGELNGTTWTEPTTGLAAGLKVLDVWAEKMFVSGLSSAKNVVYWSITATAGSPNNIYNFTGAGSGSDLIGEGGEVVGLKAGKDFLFVFKRDAIHYYYDIDFTGATPVPRQKRLTGTRGAVNQKCIARAANDIIYFDGTNIVVLAPESGVDRVEAEKRTLAIEPYLESALDDDQKNCCAVYDKRRNEYHLWVKGKNKNFNNINVIYDIDNQAILLDDTKIANVATPFQNDVYWGSDLEGFVYKNYDVFDDDGLAINSKYYTKQFHLGFPTKRKIWRKVRIYGQMSISASIDVSVFIDNKFIKKYTIDSTNITAQSKGAIGMGTVGYNIIGYNQAGITADWYDFEYELSFREKGQRIQLLFESNSVNSRFRIKEYDLGYIFVDDATFPVNRKS